MGSTITRQLTSLLNGTLSYEHDNKQKFHLIGQKVCRKIAKALGLAPGTFDVRSNMGGIAVSGEVTLHGENIYIQFSQTGYHNGDIMYRKCEGRKDYCGKINHYLTCDYLDRNFDGAIAAFKDVRKVG
jgi:hypothetical protein